MVVPRSLLKLLLSAFPAGLLTLGCHCPVRSALPSLAVHSILLWACWLYMDVPATAPPVHREQQDLVVWAKRSLRSVPSCRSKCCVAGDELVSGNAGRALRPLTGSVSLRGSGLEGHLCPKWHGSAIRLKMFLTWLPLLSVGPQGRFTLCGPGGLQFHRM